MKFHLRRAATALFVVTSSVLSLAHAASISGQGTWESTLLGRDLDGNLSTFEAYYDTNLDITWLVNANYAGTTMNWSTANAWAASLNPYGSGITGWRLPTVSPIDGTTVDDWIMAYNGTEDLGYNVSAPGTLYAGSTASEIAHLFYNTLGDTGYCAPTSVYPDCIVTSGFGLSNTGPFSSVQSYGYWSATQYALNPQYNAWGFDFTGGIQNYYNKPNLNYAWAVHTGDVGASAVPVPAAVWLFGSGLLGLVGMARRKKEVA